jgi:LacI family transcriptional regulator
VLRAARELNYTANFAGRALRLSRTRTIALIVPDLTNAIFAEMTRGVEDAAAETDHIVLLGRAERLTSEENMLHRLVGQGRVDGFLVQRRDDGDDRALQHLLVRNASVVLINSRHHARAGSVILDDAAGARLATEHLLGLGHRRIGLLGGQRVTGTAVRREEGFRAALRAAGVRTRRDWVTRLGYGPGDGRHALAQLMQADQRPTGVVVANVNAAIGALGAASELGIRVPEELSIVAVHDSWPAEHTGPPLTTVKMPLYELGRRAVHMLAGVLDSRPATDEVVTEPQPALQVRASTAPPS